MSLRYKSLSLALGLLVSVSAHAAWNENSRTPEQTTTLKKVEALVTQTKNSVVVFDLDSTLYKNYGRWEKILQEYGNAKNISQLKNFKASQISDSWDMEGILKNDAQIPSDQVAQILPDFKKFWAERFFASDYVKYDEVLPGAVAYVKDLYAKGAYILYVTGRDQTGQGAGTKAKLVADGFPLNVARTQLLMKSTNNAALQAQAKTPEQYKALLAKTDIEFKANAIKTAKSLGTVVASFDNDPAHTNQYYQAFQAGNASGVAIFVDTDKPMNSPAVEKDVLKVSGFLE